MFVIDRIEGEFAVVLFEDEYLDVPLSAFREEVKAGDVLYFVVDKEETERRTAKSKSRLFSLFNRKNVQEEVEEIEDVVKDSADEIDEIVEE